MRSRQTACATTACAKWKCAPAPPACWKPARTDGSIGAWSRSPGCPTCWAAPTLSRALQLLPGVSTNNDYSSGVRIQGCDASLNLLELDGAPVFNASHLLGLFSTFNASHFRGMSLVKNRHGADFPNRLGGRLSFHPLDSLVRRVHLDATFSFMESEGTLALPAGRGSTLYLSGRGSYLDLLYGPLLKFDGLGLGYGLQDYNLTWVCHPGERDRLRLSLYHGLDRMQLRQEGFWQLQPHGLAQLHGRPELGTPRATRHRPTASHVQPLRVHARHGPQRPGLCMGNRHPAGRICRTGRMDGRTHDMERRGGIPLLSRPPDGLPHRRLLLAVVHPGTA